MHICSRSSSYPLYTRTYEGVWISYLICSLAM